MKTKNLQDLIDQFNSGLPENSLYTLLTFQKGITHISKPLITDTTNFVAVFLAFNHVHLKIERFLVNYGAPYTLQIPDATNGYNNLEYNHVIQVDQFNQGKGKLSVNNVIDGKFNKKFFQIFYSNILMNKILKNEANFHGVNDIRLINELYHKSPSSLEYRIEADSKYIELNPKKKKIINIPKRFYSDAFNSSMENYVPFLSCSGYDFKDLPKGFEYFRRTINARNFINNYELQRQVTQFNNKLTSLAEGHKSKKESN